MKITLKDGPVRNALYVVFATTSLALFAVKVFCAASEGLYAAPPWLVPAMTTLTALGSAVGFLASANTPTEGAPPQQIEPADPEPGTVPARAA